MWYKIFWALKTPLYFFYGLFFKFPSYLGKPVFISVQGSTVFGKRFRCFPGLRLEVMKNAKLLVGDNVALAQNVHITCGKNITISSGVCIAANVCITDIKHDYSSPFNNILGSVDTYDATFIGEDSFIGYGAVVDAGTKLGKGCVVGANSYVKGEFPDFSVVAGNPARLIKTYV